MDKKEAMAAGLDLWPHTLQQTLKGTDGSEHEQVLSAMSVRAGIAAGLIDAEDFEGQDYEHLAMLVVQEPQLDEGADDDTAVMVCQLLDRESLLRWTVGLTQRLVADIGPARAREIVQGEMEIKVPRAESKA